MPWTDVQNTSAKEKDLYELHYHYTYDGLNEAAGYLDDLSISAFGADRTRLRVEASNRRAERDMCKRMRDGFWAGQSKIEPPSQTDVQAASKLADEVDAIINDGKAANRMIAIATNLFALFNRLNRL